MKKLFTLALLFFWAAAAAQVYPYYPPPGKTYSASTGKATVTVPAAADFLGWDASFTTKANAHWWGWNFVGDAGNQHSILSAYPQDDTQTDGCFPWLQIFRLGTIVTQTYLQAGGNTCAARESYAQLLLKSSADIFFNENFSGPADVWFTNANNGVANNAYIRANFSADGTNYLRFISMPVTYTAGAILTNGLSTAPWAGFYTVSACSPLEFGTDTSQAFYIDCSQSLVATGATGGGKGSGTWNAKAYYVNGAGPILPSLVGTSGSIGGNALVAGACSAGTVSITGADTTMVVQTTPVTYPGDGAEWEAYVSSANTVTIKVCAIIALTPTASTYNVRVIQ